jgi:hypothetical protein
MSTNSYALIKNGVVQLVAAAGPGYTNPTYDLTINVDNVNPRPGPGWTYSNGTFTAPPPPPPPAPTTIYSKFGFRSRFTLQELVAIDNAVANPNLTDVQKGTLNTIGKNFEVADEVDLTHPATIVGIQYLVSVGLLTSQRGTEILTP